MDHQAIAQLLGNYGEFVGALAVVATLFYLAVQVRQNSAQLRESVSATKAATMQAANESLIQLNITIAQSPELAAFHLISAEDFRGLPLVEQRRCTALHLSALRVFQHLFRQYEAGLIDRDEWEETRAGLKGVLRSSGANEIYCSFRDRGFFSEEFVADVERSS
jgi:hypothetical protein